MEDTLRKLIFKLCDELKNFAKNLPEGQASPKYYIRVENPDMAIGDGEIDIEVVDSDEMPVENGMICCITTEGKLARYSSLSKDPGLSFDPEQEGLNIIELDEKVR